MSKRCPKCNSVVPDQAVFCGVCGTRFNVQGIRPPQGGPVSPQGSSGSPQGGPWSSQGSSGSPQGGMTPQGQMSGASGSGNVQGMQPGYQSVQPNRNYGQYGGAQNQPYIPEEYRPISMWGYFGYEILFYIPVVGLILLIVYSFGAKNVNVKNFARSHFCGGIVLFIIVVLICLVIVAAGYSYR